MTLPGEIWSDFLTDFNNEVRTQNQLEKMSHLGLLWLVGYYGISTFVGYLTPNPFLCK